MVSRLLQKRSDPGGVDLDRCLVSQSQRSLLERLAPAGLVLSRLLGSSTGCFAVEIEDSKGKVVRQALVSRGRGHYTAIAPAALAARDLAEGKFERRGLVLPDRQVEPGRLIEYLRALGIEYHS